MTFVQSKNGVVDGNRCSPLFFVLYYMNFSWLWVTSVTPNIQLGKSDLHFSISHFSFKTLMSSGPYNFVKTMDTLQNFLIFQWFFKICMLKGPFTHNPIDTFFELFFFPFSLSSIPGEDEKQVYKAELSLRKMCQIYQFARVIAQIKCHDNIFLNYTGISGYVLLLLWP